MKKVIINADDFGYSKVFNKEILKLAEEEMIMGISVMVDYIKDDQKRQIEEVKKYKNNLGLHVDFENIDLNKTTFSQEIKRQFDKFKKIFDFSPVFLDMHKYAYRIEGQKAIQEFAEKNKIFFRKLDNEKSFYTTSEKKITGSFLTFEEVVEKIKKLPENSSVVVLFHPGVFDSDCKSSFNKEREEDVKNIRLLNKFIDSNNDFTKIGYNDLK